MKLKEIRLDKLNFTSTPVRKGRSAAAFERLKQSIKATVQPLVPPVVRDLGTDEFIIVDGETRVKAMLELGYAPNFKVQCLVGNFTDEEALEFGLIENILRQALTPYEEAEAVKTLVKDYGYKQLDVAQKLGKNKTYISELLAVFGLVKEALTALRNSDITLGHARAMLPLRNAPEKQGTVLRKILQRGLSKQETAVEVKRALKMGDNWFLNPVSVSLSKEVHVNIQPKGKGMYIGFSASSVQDVESVLKYLRKKIT